MAFGRETGTLLVYGLGILDGGGMRLWLDSIALGGSGRDIPAVTEEYMGRWFCSTVVTLSDRIS